MHFIALEPNTPTDLTALVAPSSLTVTWDAPVSGLVGKYEIQLKDQTGTKQIIDADVRRGIFANLTPGTQYTVVVTAVSGDQRSVPLEKNFRTSEFHLLGVCVCVCARACVCVCVCVCARTRMHVCIFS